MSYLVEIERKKTTALTVLFFSASGAVLPALCAVLPGPLRGTAGRLRLVSYAPAIRRYPDRSSAKL
jgi:hypothetical protein